MNYLQSIQEKRNTVSLLELIIVLPIKIFLFTLSILTSIVILTLYNFAPFIRELIKYYLQQ